jgi:hypothetical protein
MFVLGVLTLVLCSLVVLGGFVVWLVSRILSGVSSAGGWSALATAYTAGFEPSGQRFERQTLMVGSVQYRRCVTVVVADAGLYLAARLGFTSQPALLLPWADLHPRGSTSLYWQAAERLDIGEPACGTLTIFSPLYASVAARLPGAARVS